jgi:hypothetical protein
MKRLLLLIVFASGAAYAQGIDIPVDSDTIFAGTLDFEASVTAGVTELVTTVAPSIMPFGWTLLALFGVYALLQALLQGTMRTFASGHHHSNMATTVAYVAILFRIVIAAAMLSWYMTPIPGVPFNFHQMFPYLANALSQAINTDLLAQVITAFNKAIHYLPSAGMFEILPALLTVLVLIIFAIAEVGMTIITAGSYAIIGLLTLCGPLMIPFYVLPGHEKRFWSWFDNMLAYSMYVFVGTGFIFIFCHPYIQFFLNMHSYSVSQWLVNLPYLLLITLVFLWTMFRVPEITHLIFGGVGGVAQGFANSMQSLAVRGIVAAAL